MGLTFTFEPGTIIFSGPDDEQTIAEAKQWRIDQDIDPNLVRLTRMDFELENGRTEKMIVIIVK